MSGLLVRVFYLSVLSLKCASHVANWAVNSFSSPSGTVPEAEASAWPSAARRVTSSSTVLLVEVEMVGAVDGV